MCRRISTDCLWQSMPRIEALPAVGRISSITVRIVVVLPAPFGPEEAEHLAAVDVQVEIDQRFDVPVMLRQTFGVQRNVFRSCSSLLCAGGAVDSWATACSAAAAVSRPWAYISRIGLA